MKCMALLLVGLLVGMSSRVHAQARTDPRLEIAGGFLLLPAAAGVALGVGLWAGGGLRWCGGWDEPDTPELKAEEQACEADRARDQHRGWLIGTGVGAPIAALGIGLIIHGAVRARRMNASSFRGRLQVLPLLARDHYGLLALRRF